MLPACVSLCFVPFLVLLVEDSTAAQASLVCAAGYSRKTTKLDMQQSLNTHENIEVIAIGSNYPLKYSQCIYPALISKWAVVSRSRIYSFT